MVDKIWARNLNTELRGGLLAGCKLIYVTTGLIFYQGGEEYNLLPCSPWDALLHTNMQQWKKKKNSNVAIRKCGVLFKARWKHSFRVVLTFLGCWHFHNLSLYTGSSLMDSKQVQFFPDLNKTFTLLFFYF